MTHRIRIPKCQSGYYRIAETARRSNTRFFFVISLVILAFFTIGFVVALSS